MILNETKPPLEEALVHYGVPGMKWGRRRARNRSSVDEYDEMMSEQERHDRTKRRIATGALVTAGAVATVVILHKTGHVKISPTLIASSKAAASRIKLKSPAEERSRAKKPFRDARNAYKNSNFAKRTFRPEEVRNPLWSVSPRVNRVKPTKLNDGMAESVMNNGIYKIHTMDKDIWATPASFYAKKKR